MRGPIDFKKYSGAGNTFLIHKSLGVEMDPLLPNEIAWICANAARQPTDGLIVLKKIEEDYFSWDFYNQDGSPAEMCGNAARCVGAIIFDGSQQENIKLRTIAGDVQIQKVGPNFKVKMPKVKSPVMPVKLSVESLEVWGRFVDSGVPHFVWEIEPDKDFSEYKSKARTIRGHNFFRPKGTNVTLVKSIGPFECSAVTFERGVEDFTQACGTGAVAAARVLAKSKEDVFTIAMPGGKLMVSFEQDINQPLLIGPAQFIEDVRVGEIKI